MSKDNFYTIDKKLMKKLLLENENELYSNDQVIAMMEKLDGAILKGTNVFQPTESWD